MFVDGCGNLSKKGWLNSLHVKYTDRGGRDTDTTWQQEYKRVVFVLRETLIRVVFVL